MHEARDRKNTVMFFVSDEEKKEIKSRAAAARQTISRYCRNLALGKKEKQED